MYGKKNYTSFLTLKRKIVYELSIEKEIILTQSYGTNNWEHITHFVESNQH